MDSHFAGQQALSPPWFLQSFGDNCLPMKGQPGPNALGHPCSSKQLSNSSVTIIFAIMKRKMYVKWEVCEI